MHEWLWHTEVGVRIERVGEVRGARGDGAGKRGNVTGRGDWRSCVEAVCWRANERISMQLTWRGCGWDWVDLCAAGVCG